MTLPDGRHSLDPDRMGDVVMDIRRRSDIARTLAILLAAAGTAAAAGPIVPRYAADPSPHAFKGQVYLYATDDASNSGRYWDSTAWRLYTSRDLKTWTDRGAVLDVGVFRWAPPAAKAWAPEAAFRNRTYYFYAPVGGDRIGVAVARQPEGPFRDARGTPLIDKARDANAGDEPIDPSVLIDDDGQAFLFFGTRKPKVVALASDMIHTVGAIRDVAISGLPPGGPQKYGEAPFISKHDGRYYFSFSTGWPGQIAYATGTSPAGPFTYRGVILDYRKLSTNHHALFDWKGASYLFYHDRFGPGASDYRRAITYAPLTYRRDGTIAEVIPPGETGSAAEHARP